MKKKILCGLLALCMLLALLPATAPPALAASGSVIRSGGFSATGSTTDSSYNKDTSNCMYVYLNSGLNASDYVFTYKCSGTGSDKAGIDETKAENTKTGGTTYPWVSWHVDYSNLKPGKYTVSAYSKDSYSDENKGDALGTVKFEIVKYTLDSQNGTINVNNDNGENGGQKSGNDKYVVFGEPNEFYFRTYRGVTATPGGESAGNNFIGWSVKQSSDDPYNDIIESNTSSHKFLMPEAEANGERTLYALYGTSKITKVTMKAVDINTDKVKQDGKSDWRLEYENIFVTASSEKQAVAKVVFTNEGNQPVSIPNLSSGFGPYSVEAATTGTASETSSLWYSLPKQNDAVTYTFYLPGNSATGNYSHNDTFRAASSICYLSISASVGKGKVEVTLDDSKLSKGYGATWTSENLAQAVTTPQNFASLGITLTSTGLDASADVNETGYEITVANSGSYVVQLQGEPKLKVTKATPKLSGDKPEVTITVGQALSEAPHNFLFVNSNNPAQSVPGSIEWDNGAQTWDKAGDQDAAFTFTPTDSGKYTGPVEETATVHVVEKVVPTLIPDRENEKVAYNSQTHAVTFTVSAPADSKEYESELKDARVDVTYAIQEGDGFKPIEGEPEEAGVYQVTATTEATTHFSSATVTTTITITPKEISVNNVSIQSKTYNGKTDDAKVTAIDLVGIVSGDDAKADLESCTAVYSSPDVSSKNPNHVVVSNITLTGGDAGNYSLKSSKYDAFGVVTPAEVTVEVSAADGKVTKEYGEDRNLTAGDFTFKAGGEPVDFVNTAEFISDGEPAKANAGSYDITVEITNKNYSFADGKSETTITGGMTVKKFDLANLYTDGVTAGFGHKGNKLGSVKSLTGSFLNPHNQEAVTGTLAWKDENQDMGSESTFTATWVFTPDQKFAENYDLSGTCTGTVVIELRDKYVVKLSIDDNSRTAVYDGETHSVSAKVLPCEGHEEEAGIDAKQAEELTKKIVYKYRPHADLASSTPEPTDGTWSDEAPKNAGMYDALIAIEVPDNLAGTHEANVMTVTLVITQAVPNIEGVEFKPIAEGSFLSDVQPAKRPTGVNGEELEGVFIWPEGSTQIVTDGMTFTWTFTPNDPNYQSVSGSSAIYLAEDPRSVTASVYNLPGDTGDYAVITGLTGSFKPGDKVGFYSDADCQHPISQPFTVDDAVDGAIRQQIDLNAGALSAEGGSIWAKVDGVKTTAKEIKYSQEPDVTLDAVSVHIHEGDTATVTATATGGTPESYEWTVVNADAVELKDADKSAVTLTAMTGGVETELTVTVKFPHPDETRQGETVSVTKTVTVKINNLYDVIIGKTANGSVSASPTEGKGGETVTLTITPNEGYELADITAAQADGTAVTLEGEGNTRTFKLPESDVTVTATFKAINYNITVDPTPVHGSVNPGASTATVGETVTLTVTPEDGYEIGSVTVATTSGDNVDVTNSGETYTFTMPASDVTVTATFKAVVYKVTIANTVNGTVTAEPENAEAGTKIELTVTPSDGYELDTLTVTQDDETNTPVAVTDNKSFTMPASNVTVTATFKAVIYKVTIASTVNGTVTAEPKEAEAGTKIELTVTPNSGYELDTLTVTQDDDANTPVTVTDNKSFTMPASNVTVTATFKETVVEPTVYTVNIDKNITNGSVEASPTEAKAGETITLTVTPSDGYELDTLTVTQDDEDKTTVAVTDNKFFTMPASNVTVTATFKEAVVEPTIYKVNIDKNITNGSVEASPTEAEAGKTITLTVTPNSGYELDTLTVTQDDDANTPVDVTDNNSFTMPASDVTVTATFKETVVEPTVYTVNIDENIKNGTVKASPEKAEAGETITLTVTPNQGYEVNTVTVADSADKDVEVTEKDGTYTFTMPASDVTVTATFKETVVEPTVYTVNIDENIKNGTVKASPEKAEAGAKIELTVTPASGYELDKLTVTQDDEAKTPVTVTGSTFTMPASDVTVTATFRVKQYGGGGGSIGGGAVTPPPASSSVTVPEEPDNGDVDLSASAAKPGDTVTITPAPSDGYWTGDVTVRDANGNEVPVTRNADGTYSFVMPEGGPVTVDVAFDKVVASNLFPDLASDGWYAPYADYTVAHYIFKGAEDGKFHPEGTTTRAEVMTILARLDGENVDGGSPWYGKAVEWAVSAKVSDGTEPTAVISREQVVTMMWRAMGEEISGETLDSYVDLDSVSSWAAAAFRWAVEKGIINGKPGQLLDPQGTCTRAELAKMVTVLATMDK